MASGSSNGDLSISEKSENKGMMWELDRDLDQPIDEATGRLHTMYREKKFSTILLCQLAFQSLGVVFGDLGTSPLYVFNNVFPDGVKDKEDIVGALSLIIYSLTLLPLIKYVLIVLRANDNGQGGTFALYSLLCRHAKISTIPNQHKTDERLTTYSRQTYDENSLPAKIKKFMEANSFTKNAILTIVLVGTCMAVGDSILTPAISVLSASGGIKVEFTKMSNDWVVIVSVVILIGLFNLQHFGTEKVSRLFAPIVLLWFLLIGTVGAINLWKYDSTVLKAFNPANIYLYFKRGSHNWTSLGGIMLSITGTEALFADLCHFPVLAIQIAFAVIVFPCLLLAYTGQAAYISSNTDHVSDAFYRSIPDSIFWPVFLIATAAAVVASQATISATFSLIKQAVSMGCFPRVKVVHTSQEHLGQIYIPEINWLLLGLCIAVTAGFRRETIIANAYGTAVVIVMLVTTFLMVPIMFLVWRSHWSIVFLFTGFSLLVELTYFSAVILKVDQGGWVPLVIASCFLIIMYTWHYGTLKRFECEIQTKVSVAWILGLGPSLGLVRVPGIGFVYTELASGVPHIFSHLVTNLPAVHSVVVFVCVKCLPVYTVPAEERILVKRIGPKNFHIFRCVVRYGYKDVHKKDDNFETMLYNGIVRFATCEGMMEFGGYSDSEEYNTVTSSIDGEILPGEKELVHRRGSLVIPPVQANHFSIETTDEIEFLNICKDGGMVHILGNTVVRSRRDSNMMKKVAIDYLYAFLRRLCRENSVMLYLPHESLLNVGQIFYV
ncbi:hypothetical protein LUZ63_011659 [Rhynchospora breviuscula]|uniref:Potassium transporter n=1 Tax=Rhynchospora breviuscula TaxID=2022672 RepID=A0A9Q0HQN9_9POAL|nr:hypothetical protein LUZ63_011659 [Rhynchospora breviuscula]